MGFLNPLAAGAAPHLAGVPVAVAITPADHGVLRVLAVLGAGRSGGQLLQAPEWAGWTPALQVVQAMPSLYCLYRDKTTCNKLKYFVWGTF